MNNQQRILRTETGYQLGQLHAADLSPRQSQVLLLRANGLQAKQCAEQLNCSTNNVRKLLAELFYKLRVKSSAELITKAFEKGHLRFLSTLFFIGLCLSTNCINENPNSLARTGRSNSSSLRLQRNGRRETEVV